MIATEALPWHIPRSSSAGGTPRLAIWFAGQAGLDSGITSIAYDSISGCLVLRFEMKTACEAPRPVGRSTGLGQLRAGRASAA